MAVLQFRRASSSLIQPTRRLGMVVVNGVFHRLVDKMSCGRT